MVLLQGVPVGMAVFVVLLLVAMTLPVVVVLAIALWVTRDQWGDRKDYADGAGPPGDEADDAGPGDRNG
ncbi:hypothetical protein [Haloarcula litorea]|uniref:hypothetical protein n=1 Tax=Haloarcula litorea TaxID=3032579 RepID=UPI0023E80BC3|nr:hypothetical protein [Halomicroarcula sp. GDY20]